MRIVPYPSNFISGQKVTKNKTHLIYHKLQKNNFYYGWKKFLGLSTLTDLQLTCSEVNNTFWNSVVCYLNKAVSEPEFVESVISDLIKHPSDVLGMVSKCKNSFKNEYLPLWVINIIFLGYKALIGSKKDHLAPTQSLGKSWRRLGFFALEIFILKTPGFFLYFPVLKPFKRRRCARFLFRFIAAWNFCRSFDARIAKTFRLISKISNLDFEPFFGNKQRKNEHRWKCEFWFYVRLNPAFTFTKSFSEF